MEKWEEIRKNLVKKLMDKGLPKYKAESLVDNSGIDFMLSTTPEIILNTTYDKLIDMVLK